MNNMTPIDWAIRPLKNYANFSGRASRAEFWWFTLFVMIVYVVVMFVAGAVGGSIAAASPTSALATGSFGLLSVLMIVFWLALLVPSIAVQLRRLHDTNRSGWWLGAFWLLYIVYMGVAFRTIFNVTPGAVPNLGMAAGVGILALLMLIASITLLVFFCIRGTAGPNRYGEDPYGANVEEVFA
jgi:uncharacterized membrane protein YhaH (DUF805 family)